MPCKRNRINKGTRAPEPYSVTVDRQMFLLEILQPEEFLTGSQILEESLALEDDFRTLGSSQIVTDLPQLDQFLSL